MAIGKTSVKKIRIATGKIEIGFVFTPTLLDCMRNKLRRGKVPIFFDRNSVGDGVNAFDLFCGPMPPCRFQNPGIIRISEDIAVMVIRSEDEGAIILAIPKSTSTTFQSDLLIIIFEGFKSL